MSFSIHVEWLDAPGVNDVVDATLWARLSIVASGMDGTEVTLTSGVDVATKQLREGVYGSLFPLARWVADSYWSLLWEIPRTPRWRSGRDAARIDWLRPWVQRHCLLAAREGFSLPDVTIARDGEHLVVAAFPDNGAEAAGRRPISFITARSLHVDRAAVDAALRRFMDTVLERMRGLDHPDAHHLRADWSAIAEADPEEARLCAWAARLGVDPYDPDALDDSMVSFIEDHLVGMPEGLRTDLLDAAIGGPELVQAVAWLDANRGALHGAPEPRPIKGSPPGRTAHETGYFRARQLRNELGVGASEHNIIGVVGAELGFDFSRERAPTTPAEPPLESLLGATHPAAPVLIGQELPHETRAFRWGRALYLWRFGHLRDGPRLLTRSHERLQREGRAFAAELLAPATALRRRIRRGSVGEKEVADLASAFTVSPMLIRHQIENHALAVLE